MNIRLLEKITAKPNQKVIITITDEFLELPPRKKSLRGVLSEYANPAFTAQEDGAWERAVVEKCGG